MASPRAAISIFKCLSPQKLQSVSNIKQVLSPKSPLRNSLTVENSFKNELSPIFNIDTPHKKKLINEGFLGQFHRVLGNGAFGTVYKARYKGEDVAAKIIKNNQNTASSAGMEKETAFLRHSNIVKILKVDEGPALTLITMELCGHSLQNILEEHKIARHQKIHIWKSIAKALNYCHLMGVVHADVKPKNVLMSPDNQPKLADFGSAVFRNESNTSIIFHGTPGYAAPEVIRGNIPTPSSDVYSLGILAWQMLSRKSPFEGLHKHTIIYFTGKGIRPSDYDLEDEFQGEYKDLYKRSCNKIPEDRPNLNLVISKLKELETKSPEV